MKRMSVRLIRAQNRNWMKRALHWFVSIIEWAYDNHVMRPSEEEKLLKIHDQLESVISDWKGVSA